MVNEPVFSMFLGPCVPDAVPRGSKSVPEGSGRGLGGVWEMPGRGLDGS